MIRFLAAFHAGCSDSAWKREARSRSGQTKVLILRRVREMLLRGWFETKAVGRGRASPVTGRLKKSEKKARLDECTEEYYKRN